MARLSAVSVEVQQEVSNAASFELVPSGTPRKLNAQLIYPLSLAVVGTDVFELARDGDSIVAGDQLYAVRHGCLAGDYPLR